MTRHTSGILAIATRHPAMFNAMTHTSTTDRTRDFVAGWLAGVPVIAPKPRVEWRFTDEQAHARAIQEARLRNADRRRMHELRSGADERRTER